MAAASGNVKPHDGRPPAVKEVQILWITAGLSCDGDSVSVTAATQPSIEDVVLGAVPGLPKVHLHNPVLAYESCDPARYCEQGDFVCRPACLERANRQAVPVRNFPML